MVISAEIEKLLEGAPQLDGWEAEYRALTTACGLVARVDRGAVRVTGERRLEMLDGLLTNQLAGLSTAGRHAMLLTAKGRVLTDLRVFPRAADLLLDVPRAGLTNLLAALRKYLPPLYATHQDVSADCGQLAIYGRAAAAAAREAFGEAPPGKHLGVRELPVEEGSPLLIRNRRLAGDGVEVIVGADAVEAVAGRLLSAVRALGGRPVGGQALEVVRVESGVPAYGRDIDESNLAPETGLEEEAISYDKGCYLGQEVVARIHFRGHVNRRLVGLKFGDDSPGPGAALVLGAKEVGVVTSAVVSPTLGAIGLGYVRREIGPGSVLRWTERAREGSAAVAELPHRTRFEVADSDA